MVEYCFTNAVTREVELSIIRVDPRKRIRKYNTTSKTSIKRKALKSSMDKFGLINSITLLKNYEIKAGYQRYDIALELNWKTIRCRIFLTELTKLEELLLEITENYARNDFSSFEFFAGIAMTKREYEKEHPEIMHGKAKKNQRSPLKDPKKKGGNKVASDATFKNDQNVQVLSFIKEYHNFFGVAERTFRNYSRIGEAYLDNKFSKESIELFNEGKLTQTQLLETLRKLDNKIIIQAKLKSLKENHPLHNKSVTVESPTRSKKPSRKSKKAPKAKSKTLEEKKDVVLKIRKEIVEGFINSGKDIITPQKNKTPIKKALLNQPEKYVDKPSIRNESFTLKNNLSNISFENSSMEDICFNCPKATVLAIKCKSCGDYTTKVHCKIDFIDNRHILRDPSLPRCENSLDSELRLPGPNLLPC